MADHWEPIRVYEVGVTAPDCDTTKQQIVAWLEATDPDRIESAGQSYLQAAKLIRDEGGVQDAIMTAANGLSRAWRGEDATKALKALRLLYASAGALADAMHDTGRPMTDYAREVRTTREKVAAPANSAPLLSNDRLFTNGGNYGAYGGSGLGTGQTAPPLITGNGSLPNTPLLPPAAQVDAQARKDLEDLNVKIASLNSQLAEGLAFQMPDITPLEVDLQKQDKLDPGSGSRTSTGTTTYWNGGGTDGGGPGSGAGSGSGGGTGGGDTGNGPESGEDTPQDPDRTDPEQGRDDPSTDPQDPSTPEQPGGPGEQQQPPGQNQGQDGADQQQDVPPVIGADNKDQTQLADAGNPTTTTPPGTTTNPYQTTTPNGTIIPTTQPPASTPNPYASAQPGAATWYGTNGTAPAATPAVLRGGTATPGSGFMTYPPGVGMGAAAGNEGDERTREIYDPEPGVWSVPHEAGPEKIG
ncbi:hypothetical protein EDD27_10277 [Nonomuraea polychroma]|uniref:PPE family protein n=1 Tax=Nonomuraea polychroma TaxID=46176 RepID=A0A438MNE6_9ACTN|nr:hypothetical protein [Nonomuraea polychroma]RVX47347.1 hypothetical protein EDD27_10277 [Nonomuraea polychroma]